MPMDLAAQRVLLMALPTRLADAVAEELEGREYDDLDHAYGYDCTTDSATGRLVMRLDEAAVAMADENPGVGYALEDVWLEPLGGEGVLVTAGVPVQDGVNRVSAVVVRTPLTDLPATHDGARAWAADMVEGILLALSTCRVEAVAA